MFGVFSTLMIFFYNSNMRNNLISPEYEKPLRTLDDIYNRGQRVYIATDFRRAVSVELLNDST